MTQTFESRDAWLAARMHGIGGSDAPVVLGLSPFDTPYAMAMRKRGLAPDKDETEDMVWGTVLEPSLRKLFESSSGMRVETDPPFSLRRCTVVDQEFMHASLDGIIAGADGPGVLEVKVTDRVSPRELEDETSPTRMLFDAQLLHNMAVTGFSWGAVAALVGRKFRWYRLERNNQRISEIVAAERAYWEAVTRGDDMEPDGSQVTLDTVRSAWPRGNGKPVMLPDEAVIDFEEWDAAKRAYVAAEEKYRKAQSRMYARMKDADFAALANGVRLRMKNVRRGNSVSRVLERVGGKP